MQSYLNNLLSVISAEADNHDWINMSDCMNHACSIIFKRPYSTPGLKVLLRRAQVTGVPDLVRWCTVMSSLRLPALFSATVVVRTIVSLWRRAVWSEALQHTGNKVLDEFQIELAASWATVSTEVFNGCALQVGMPARLCRCVALGRFLLNPQGPIRSAPLAASFARGHHGLYLTTFVVRYSFFKIHATSKTEELRHAAMHHRVCRGNRHKLKVPSLLAMNIYENGTLSSPNVLR